MPSLIRMGKILLYTPCNHRKIQGNEIGKGESTLGIIGTVIGIVVGILSVAPIVTQVIKTAVLRNPIKRLYDALGKGQSITTKSEIEYQIRCYVPQKFLQ